MSEKESAQDVIDAYRKRQQKAKRAPLVIGVALLLVFIGVIIVGYWFLADSLPSISLFPTETATPSSTPTATSTGTATPSPTVTPTITNTPTITLTPTASGPFIYQVEEGDNLWLIAEKFGVDLLAVITLNNLDPANPAIQVGDKLTIPGPDTQLPTATPLPSDLPRGSKIEYQIQLGDLILAIALKFNSTVESIKEENQIENENEIFVGQVITVRANLVTPVPTDTPEPTAGPGTPAATVTPTQ